MDPQNQYNFFTDLPYKTVVLMLKRLLKQDVLETEIICLRYQTVVFLCNFKR